MRRPTAYRKGRNLHHYAKALVEYDRAEAAVEDQRQRVYGLMLGPGDASDQVRRAMKTFRLALFRRNYAKTNVARFGERMRT